MALTSTQATETYTSPIYLFAYFHGHTTLNRKPRRNCRTRCVFRCSAAMPFQNGVHAQHIYMCGIRFFLVFGILQTYIKSGIPKVIGTIYVFPVFHHQRPNDVYLPILYGSIQLGWRLICCNNCCFGLCRLWYTPVPFFFGDGSSFIQ